MPLSNLPPVKPSANSATGKARASKADVRAQDRVEALTGFGMLAQVPLLATKQYADAGTITQYWPGVAKEIATLADTQPAIAKVIDPLLQVGPYAALITAALPMIMQLAVNHKMMPAGAMGTVPGTLIGAQVEAGLAQQEIEALRAQREAEKAAEAMRREIAEQRAGLEHDIPAEYPAE